jgi:hypothetical protein
MWTVARCAAEAVPLEAEQITVRARFKAPVLLPGTVTYAAHAAPGGFELRSGDRVHLTGEVVPSAGRS